MECDAIKHREVKKLVSDEYTKRLKRMLRSKLNGGNLMRAINTYAVSEVRYTAGIVNWIREELETIDRRSRKMFTAHGGFHPKSDVDRLYTQRSVGDRGLMSIEDVGYVWYVKKRWGTYGT